MSKEIIEAKKQVVAEIAQQLKLNEGNVKVRLSRARQILKEQLKENWNNEE